MPSSGDISHTSSSPEGAPHFWLWFLLIAAVLLVFGRGISNQFVNWDDEAQIYQNQDFNPPTIKSVLSYWTKSHLNLYLPVTYTIWGAVASVARMTPGYSTTFILNPIYFHALNVLTHALAAVVAMLLLRRLAFGPWPAAAGAALFALHPMQTEAVAWVSGFYTVLSGLFSLVALWQFTIFAQAGDSRRRAALHYSLATLAFVLAMLSKPSAVVVPLMASAIDLLILHRPWRKTAIALLPWIVLTIPITIIAIRVQSAVIVKSQPIWARPLIAADAICFYLGKIVFPLQLAADYGRTPDWALQSRIAFFTWIVPVAVLLAAVLFRRKVPLALPAFAMIVLATLPFLGLKKFDFQWFSTVADRYLYFGMIGPAILFAGILSIVKNKRAATWIAGIVLLLLAIRTMVRVEVWSDTETLWKATIDTNPTSLVANRGMGYLETQRGNDRLAIVYYQAALKSVPDDPWTNFNLANRLASLKQWDAADEHYQAAARRDPYDPRYLSGWGNACMLSGRFDMAERLFNEVLAIDMSRLPPDRDVRVPVHCNLGTILLKRGDKAGAAAHFNQALALIPGFSPAVEGLWQRNIDSPGIDLLNLWEAPYPG